MALTVVLGALWLIAVLGAPILAEPVADLVNDVDMAVGGWSKARPPGDE